MTGITGSCTVSSCLDKCKVVRLATLCVLVCIIGARHLGTRQTGIKLLSPEGKAYSQDFVVTR